MRHCKKINETNLTDGKFVCCPSFRSRGYIEGFYGKPWSHEERKSVLSLMAKNRMNTVYYAPKDDKYHRELWRELYHEKELSKLKELVDMSAKYFLDFYWCIAPGLSMKYSDKKEFDTLIEKTGFTEVSIISEVSYMELGNKQVGIFMIPGELYLELETGAFLPAEESATGKEAEYKVLSEMTDCEHSFVAGLCNDELGYIIPDNDFFSTNGSPISISPTILLTENIMRKQIQ